MQSSNRKNYPAEVVERLNPLLLALYPLALSSDIDSFEPRFFELITRYLDFSAGWTGRASVTADSATMHSTYLHNLPIECAIEWDQYKSNDPSVAERLSGNKAPLNVTPSALELAPDYRDFLKKYAIEQGLLAVHEDAEMGLHTFLSLYRDDPVHKFSNEDAILIDYLMPHLFSAMNINRTNYFARMKSAVETSFTSFGICDRYATLQFADGEFVKSMQKQWTNWKGPVLPVDFSIRIANRQFGDFSTQTINVDISNVRDFYLLKIRAISPIDALTKRESDIARAYSKGGSYKELARSLDISVATVKFHLRNVYIKLGVKDKGELATFM
jgi:DNA-binding CsgD family transcriptional regulator